MTDFVAEVSRLRTVMWRTAGARFWAFNRLTRREKFSTFSIALLSAYGVLIGVTDWLPESSSDRFESSLGALPWIAISLFVLVLSLIEGSAGLALKAYRLHQSGIEINELQRQLGLLLVRHPNPSDVAWDQVDSIRQAYDRLIRQCPDNHEPIDDLRFLADQRKSPEFAGRGHDGFSGVFFAARVVVLHWLSAIWLPLTSIGVVAAITVFAICI